MLKRDYYFVATPTPASPFPYHNFHSKLFVCFLIILMSNAIGTYLYLNITHTSVNISIKSYFIKLII